MTQPHSPLTDEQIYIRPFREDDLHVVQELFAESFGGCESRHLTVVEGNKGLTLYPAGSPKQIALDIGYTQMPSIISYIFIVNSLVLFLGHHHVLGALFAVGGTSLFLAYRSFLSNFFTSYIKECFNDDLADISKHYKIQPATNANQKAGEAVAMGKSAFWVAEAMSTNGEPNIIVGTIALGMFEVLKQFSI